MIHEINMHHRLVLACGATGRRVVDQPSHELDLQQGISADGSNWSIYLYLTNFKPTFGLPPEAFISGDIAYIKDPAGTTELSITSDKYTCLDGYDDGWPLDHQRPRARNLVALMYWLDQLNDWHGWGLVPLWKYYQVSDQTSSVHAYVLNDTILDGENWHHVDIIQQIRNRITEVAKLLGFTDGSKFYLGQVGQLYATTSDGRDATLDTRWATGRLEIGQYGKFTKAEYFEVFPGTMWGGTKKKLSTRPSDNYPTDYLAVNQDSPALHLGISVHPGDHTYSGYKDNSYNRFYPVIGQAVVDYDWTTTDANAANTNGDGSTANSFFQGTDFNYSLAYAYNVLNANSIQGGTASLTYANNPNMACVYLGGQSLTKRYGYKPKGDIAYTYQSLKTSTNTPYTNTLTVAQIFNALSVTYKLELCKSNSTQFPKTGSSSYKIHHDFYHSFELVETLKTFTVDLIANPNVDSGITVGGIFGTTLPLITEDEIDVSPMWAIDNAQWLSLRLKAEVTLDINDPETFVTAGVDAAFSYTGQINFNLSSRAVSTEDWYLPFFSYHLGIPTNPVYAPYNIRGLYPSIDSSSFIRNSIWTS